MKKVFTLLLLLVVYVNYTNYVEQDSSKLYQSIENLKQRVVQEKEIEKRDVKKEELLLDADKLMFEKLNYSNAMGKLQDIINQSAKSNCKVKSIKWAQTPSNDLWYDRLRMNLSLECTPKELYTFTNNLKKHKKLFVINNFRTTPVRNKDKLYVSMQVMAFRRSK